MYQIKKIGTKKFCQTHRITLSRTKTKLVNEAHSILLDKYDYQADLTDIFSKSCIEWLKSLTPMVTPVDRIILDSSIASIEAINQQIDTVSKEISKYAEDNKDVKILLSITGIDVFSVQCSHIHRNSGCKTVFHTMDGN